MVASHILEILFKELTVGHCHDGTVLGFHPGGDNSCQELSLLHLHIPICHQGEPLPVISDIPGEEIFKRILQGKTDTHTCSSDSGNKAGLIDVKNEYYHYNIA